MKNGFGIIANAIVWGIILIACSTALKNAETSRDIQLILGGGAAISLLVVATAGIRKRS